MINILSTVDGFKVIMGSWIVNLAALLTLLLAIRSPPDYGEDSQRTYHAKLLFSGLVLIHLFLGIVKYVSLFLSRVFWDWIVLFCLVNIVVMVYICQNWLYIDGRDINDLTPEQYKFELWLWTELMLIYTSIASSAIYITACYFRHPTVVISSQLDGENIFSDFLDAHMLMVDFMNSIFAPGLIALMIAFSNMATSSEQSLALTQGILLIL